MTSLLVSEGARAFAEGHQVARVDPETMKSPRAEDEWRIWRDRFDAAAKAGSEVSSMASDRESIHDRQDTVGAVALDSSGGLAAGVSRYDFFTSGLSEQLSTNYAVLDLF